MINLNPSLPKRIICLTEETTETLYKIGADDLIIGITEYTVRPPQARIDKPIVSRYLDADIEIIVNMKPDIVLAWSDLQANIVKELILAGIEVFTFNHRSISGILSMILKLGNLVGRKNESEELTEKITKNINNTILRTHQYDIRPRVYFEEWFSPLITGICWVSEIIEICGGDDIFSENRIHHNAKGRILENDLKIIERNPDIMLASWCGKPFRKNTVLKRKNWDKINAVKYDNIFELDPAVILQPGPAALTDGIDIVSNIISDYLTNKG